MNKSVENLREKFLKCKEAFESKRLKQSREDQSDFEWIENRNTQK